MKYLIIILVILCSCGNNPVNPPPADNITYTKYVCHSALQVVNGEDTAFSINYTLYLNDTCYKFNKSDTLTSGRLYINNDTSMLVLGIDSFTIATWHTNWNGVTDAALDRFKATEAGRSIDMASTEGHHIPDLYFSIWNRNSWLLNFEKE